MKIKINSQEIEISKENAEKLLEKFPEELNKIYK